MGERLSDWSLVCFESQMTAPTAALEDLPRWFVDGTRGCPSRSVFLSVIIEDQGTLTGVIVDAMGSRR